MTLAGPPLRTERLVLRIPEPADVRALHLLFSDPAVMRHVGDGSLPSLQAVRALVDRQIHAHTEDRLCLLTVCLTECDGVGAGDVLGFTGVQPWTHPWGPQGVIEAGWRLGRASWGFGYATEAAAAAVAWLHERRAAGLDGSRLVAMIDTENARSCRVATKLGMAPSAEHTSPSGRHVLEYSEREGARPLEP